jgi:prepilin signal peptidase PulO-like enzyme (type II secretory pathway)
VAAQDSADAGSVRNAIRWGLLLASVGTAGFRLPRLVNEFRAWREALGLGDASAAEGLHTVLMVELIGVLVVLAIGVGVFYVLRPKVKSPG